MTKRILVYLISLVALTSVVFAQEEVERQERIEREVLRIAAVSVINGEVQVEVKDTGEVRRAELNMVLLEGDSLRTATQSGVTLRLEDGSTVSLKEGSLLTIKELKLVQETNVKESSFELLLGEIAAMVQSVSKTSDFKILTPQAVCSVRGTDFSVRVTEDQITHLEVYDGIVGIQEVSGLGEEVLVGAGEQVDVKQGEQVPEPGEIEGFEGRPVDKGEVPGVDEGLKEEVGLSPAELEEAEEEEEIVRERPRVKPVRRPGGFGFDMYGSFGAEALTDPDTGETKIYSKLSLQPELSYWKIGIGLWLDFYFDEEGKLREEEWEGGEKVLEKIMYIRYGLKGEPIYALIGGFRSLTLGHGLIMRGYSNMLQFPDIRKVGVKLDLDLGLYGLESLVTDVNKVEVYGGRVFVRPLYESSIPLLHKLAIGGSAVTDKDPDSDNDTENDEVLVYGVDADLPVFQNRLFSTLVYADLAWMRLGDSYLPPQGISKDKGRGYSTGLGGSIIEMIQWRAEYRNVQNNFVPAYFDVFYEVDRSTKPLTISGTEEPAKEGPYAEVSWNFMDKASVLISYEDFNVPKEDPNYPYIHGTAKVHPSLLMNKYGIQIDYYKRDAEKWEDIREIKGKNTVIDTTIDYYPSPNIVLRLIYRQTFDRNGEASKSTAVETRMHF